MAISECKPIFRSVACVLPNRLARLMGSVVSPNRPTTYSSFRVHTCGPLNLSASAITYVTLQTSTNRPRESLSATALSLINIAADFVCTENKRRRMTDFDGRCHAQLVVAALRRNQIKAENVNKNQRTCVHVLGQIITRIAVVACALPTTEHSFGIVQLVRQRNTNTVYTKKNRKQLSNAHSAISNRTSSRVQWNERRKLRLKRKTAEISWPSLIHIADERLHDYLIRACDP